VSARLIRGDATRIPLPDASIDAVVTDPPYGLEFMGKSWDRLGNIGQTSHQGFAKDKGFKGFRLASYSGSSNVKCRRCEKWQWDHTNRKCECDEPDFPNMRAHQGSLMQAWHQQWAEECLRVLKPGGHLLAFGGTRTYHRMTCAIEDAGFEIRDCLTWLYGSGFPKSLVVSKAIDKAAGAEREVVGYEGSDGVVRQPRAMNPNGGDRVAVQTITAPATPDAERWQGWGTALKPAHEPIVLARKPLIGTVAANVLRFGTGALNIDGCRVEYRPNDFAARTERTGTHAGEVYGHHGNVSYSGGEVAAPNPAGRWPPNVALDEDAAEMLDAQSGERNRWKLMLTYTTADAEGRNIYEANRRGSTTSDPPAGRWPPNVALDEVAAEMLDAQSGERPTGAVKPYTRADDSSPMFPVGTDLTYAKPGDTGGASRFMFVAKASTSERNAGLDKWCHCETSKLYEWEEPDPSHPEATDTTSRPRATSGASSTDECSSLMSSLGNEPTDPSPTDTSSTTTTATSSTTGLPISSSSPLPSTSASTGVANDETASGGSPADSAANSSPSPSTTGTSVPKAGPSTADADPAISPRSSRPSVCGSCGRPTGGDASGRGRNDHPT